MFRALLDGIEEIARCFDIQVPVIGKDDGLSPHSILDRSLDRKLPVNRDSQKENVLAE